jgi:hypothetical protein
MNNIFVNSMFGRVLKFNRFNKKRFVVNIVNILAISLTSGIIIPPLGFVSLSCLYLYIHYNLSSIGKMIHQKDQNEKRIILLLISNECNYLVETISYCIHIFLVPIMCFYFSIFIFDISGDDIGFKTARWSLLLLCVLPLILWILRLIKIRFINDNDKKIIINNSNNGVELENINKETINPIRL